MEAGLFINSLPVPMTKEASVFPIPVANCPKAPALHVCESVPNNTFIKQNNSKKRQKGDRVELLRTSEYISA